MFGRSWKRIIRGLFLPTQLLGVLRTIFMVKKPIKFLWIYLNYSSYKLKQGDFQVSYRLNGRRNIKVKTSHDYSTFFEVFCRRDYVIQKRDAFVLDIGSNIGISAKFFLEQHAAKKIICYEPNEENLSYLSENLKSYEEYVEIYPKAVGVKNGISNFLVEPTGRYGRLIPFASSPNNRLVEVVDINEIIQSILNNEKLIDYMKLDVEGKELEILSGLLLKNKMKITRIQYEWNGSVHVIEN